MTKRTLYATMTVGSAVGLIASFLQMLEKLSLLKNPHAALMCNINSVFSCTNVLNAWQSSVFGFPNSLMCIVFFSLTLGVALAGLRPDLQRWLRLMMHGFTLFFLCFGLWFLAESTYVVNALCIYCVFCFSGLLLINFAWLRLNVDALPLSDGSRKSLQRGINRGADIFGWLLLALCMAIAMTLHFHH